MTFPPNPLASRDLLDAWATASLRACLGVLSFAAAVTAYKWKQAKPLIRWARQMEPYMSPPPWVGSDIL
jgi:hypothetical protein